MPPVSDRVRLSRSRPRCPMPVARATRRRVVGTGQQLARLVEQRRPRRGEGDAAAVAVEELHAELGLERSNLLADAGLRDVQPLGGAAEVELLGHGDERPQLP